MSSVRSTRSHHANIPVIGIVGGVGAGKSSVIRNVSSLRLHVVDADHIGHEQLVVPEIRDRIVGVFGTRVLDDKAVTLHALADKYGVSAERVRQLEKNAMKKLREHMEGL